MNIEIKSWLDSDRDFETGVHLYSRFGQSQNLKRILERSESCQEHLDTLTYELGQLLDVTFALEKKGSTPTKVSQTGPFEIQPVIIIPPAGQYNKDDENLFQTIKDKLKLRDHLHSTLEHVSEVQRKNNALMILELSDQITEDYQRHDHFKKHGVLPPAKTIEVKPPDKPVIELSQAELEKRKLNIRTKISFYKRKINDPLSEPRRNYNRTLLLTWERKLEETLNLLS